VCVCVCVLGLKGLVVDDDFFFIHSRREFNYHHIKWVNSVKHAMDAHIISGLSNDGDSVIDSCQHARNEARSFLSALLKVL
jgi:hypothetical protein